MAERANDPIEVLVSADSHVGETDELWKRIPEPLRRYQPTAETRPDGAMLIQIEGVEVEFSVRDGTNEADFEKEFRRDPSRGTDLDLRRSHMAREGVDAQVIFPNEGLGMGVGDVPTEFRIAWARAYNDSVTITDDAVALNNVEFTGVDCLVWGNDYPHDEGTYPNSRTQIDEIEKKLGPKDARKVLCGNAARIFGFDLDYLAANKHEIQAAAESPSPSRN